MPLESLQKRIFTLIKVTKGVRANKKLSLEQSFQKMQLFFAKHLPTTWLYIKQGRFRSFFSKKSEANMYYWWHKSFKNKM